MNIYIFGEIAKWDLTVFNKLSIASKEFYTSKLRLVIEKTFYRVAIDDLCVKWFRGDRLHNTSAPAIEYINGSEEWYVNGVKHREKGPAVIYSSGTKLWYYKGKLHREDGPAVVSCNGTKIWYIHGEEQKN